MLGGSAVVVVGDVAAEDCSQVVSLMMSSWSVTSCLMVPTNLAEFSNFPGQ